MKKDLIKFLYNYNYVRDDPEDAMRQAQNVGLIEEFELLDYTHGIERRWGHHGEFTFSVNDETYYITIVVYLVGENGDDEVVDVYEVEPYEIAMIKYRRK